MSFSPGLNFWIGVEITYLLRPPCGLPADSFTTANPPHGADIGESLARLLATIVLPLALVPGNLPGTEGVFSTLLDCFHTTPLDHFTGQTTFYDKRTLKPDHRIVAVPKGRSQKVVGIGIVFPAGAFQ